MQVDNLVGEVKRAFHIVRHDDTRDMKTLLQAADQSIDAVRNDWVETGSGFIVKYQDGE